ncbi:MAG TPA: C45 family peptidase [Roseiflexaceae bacterium]|jgi:hypothetical protein|nr:C45 family peptidase [Roseiflexaceae bacterium]
MSKYLMNSSTPRETTLHEHHADYRRILLAGTPERIGRAQATYLRSVPTPFRRNVWETDMPFMRECAALLREVYAPLWIELSAFADALDMPAEKGLFVRAGALPHGCSAFVWVLPGGRVIAGRNYDFYERMPTRHLLITRPERGYGHVGMNGGLVGGRYDGMNEHGLFVALHKVMANRPNEFAPGMPYHLVLRLVLEMCDTAEAGARLVASLSHLAPFNYTLADPSGACFVVETYPGLPSQVRAEAGGIAVANHYTSPELAPLQGRRSTGDSQARVVAMRRLPSPADDAWEAAAARLRCHDSGLCCHREFGATLWSGLFDLSARRAAYAWGAPCRNAFHDVEIPTTA